MPIFQLKRVLIDPVDLHGVLYIQWGSKNRTFISTYLTQLDQALAVWGGVTAIIFCVAQFYTLSWTVQMVVWAILSTTAMLVCNRLAWFWVTTRQKRWILYTWSILVLIGLSLSAYGIFAGQGLILGNLCSIWLGVCAIGYFITGVGIQAPALSLMGTIHLGAIPVLTALPSWQFLLTGATMSSCLFCLAAFQWQHQ